MSKKPSTKPAADDSQLDGETIQCGIVRIEGARSLPEVLADEPLQPIEFADGSIERFDDGTGRTMKIVACLGGLACMVDE